MDLMDWRFYALASAFFAALTSIFGKVGVSDLNSNLATLIRTIVILGFIIAIVTFRNEWTVGEITRKNFAFLFLSGLATGASWLCYYRALKLENASKVAPLDKLSVAITIILAAVFLKESMDWKTIAGGLLIVLGSIVLGL